MPSRYSGATTARSSRHITRKMMSNVTTMISRRSLS
ncbi:Uncharacterised protein [Mycobacteroides abscessus subsp. abscessus]|nr:Uncharacterised protein [Mycobacteroides abscessus subsp. abscessus]